MRPKEAKYSGALSPKLYVRVHAYTSTHTLPTMRTHTHTHSEPLLTGGKAREREAKWLKMFANWDKSYDKIKPKVNSTSHNIISTCNIIADAFGTLN